MILFLVPGFAAGAVAYTVLVRWWWRRWNQRVTAQCAADRAALQRRFGTTPEETT